MQVELYARCGSAQSDEARALLVRVRERIPFELVDVDIDQDERLRARFERDAPVVYLEGRKVFRREVDEAALVRKLERERAFAMGTPDGAPGDRSRSTKVMFAAAAALAVAGVFAYTGVEKLVIAPELEIKSLDITPESFEAPAFTLADES